MTLVPGDPLAHRALESLLRAEASVRRRLSSDLEREGLSATGFSVLVILTTAGGELELRVLRARLRTSKANATEVVTTLEGRGLVDRRRLATDRRAASVAITQTRRGDRRPAVSRAQRAGRARLRGARRGREAQPRLDLPQAGGVALARHEAGRGIDLHSVAMAKRPVDAQVSFPELEEEVLARWRERDVFAESLRRREGAEPWVFWEGPPTANGPPGVHHVLSRAFKDIFPRYRTMRGRYVERRGGWDCHGLPVEIAVEKQLGITSKEQIEQYGIAEFNQKCRESVFAFLEDWNALTERIGFWLDLDNAYRTLDATYVESVWWSLKQIADKGMLYEGHRVVPYCPRCGTALSSHEVALGYQDVEDPSVYVRFKVKRDGGPLQAGDELLIWTTTPWTLVSNAAVAVDPELVYVRAKTGRLDAPVVLAEALVEKVLGDPAEASRSSSASPAPRSTACATSRRSAT